MDEHKTSDWRLAAKTNQVGENEPTPVHIDRFIIALYKVGDSYYATDDTCTHEFASLSEGTVEGDVIECPLHQARFHIPTGKVLDLPAEEDLRSYPVKVEGDDIYVDVAER